MAHSFALGSQANHKDCDLATLPLASKLAFGATDFWSHFTRPHFHLIAGGWSAANSRRPRGWAAEMPPLVLPTLGALDAQATWDRARGRIIQRSHHDQLALVVIFRSAPPSLASHPK
jgi:hypothetical protein